MLPTTHVIPPTTPATDPILTFWALPHILCIVDVFTIATLNHVLLGEDFAEGDFAQHSFTLNLL